MDGGCSRVSCFNVGMFLLIDKERPKYKPGVKLIPQLVRNILSGLVGFQWLSPNEPFVFFMVFSAIAKELLQFRMSVLFGVDIEPVFTREGIAVILAFGLIV